MSKAPRPPSREEIQQAYLPMRVYVEKFFEYHGIPPGGTLNGRQASDFVQDAFLAILDPYRQGYAYDPDKASFVTFVTSRVLRTLLRNALKSAQTKREKIREWAE